MTTKKLSEIAGEDIMRMSCGMHELDKIIGYTDIGIERIFGFPIGKITCLSGEHGVGKSRLSIQICKLLNKSRKKILYFQGEVPLEQFKGWFGPATHPDLVVCGDETNPSSIIEDIRSVCPSFVVVDSMNMIEGFMSIAKDNNAFFTGLRQVLNKVDAHCLMLGQMTKSGKSKGPSHVPHMVDIDCKLRLLKNATFIAESDGNRKAKLDYIRKMNSWGDAFVWEVGKNRCGRSGGWVAFYHTDAGIKFLTCKDIYDAQFIKNNQEEVAPSGGFVAKMKRWFNK